MVAERERFLDCLQRAESLSAEDTDFLADMVERYPYAQVLQMMYLRGLQLNDSFKFPSQLNRAATSAMRREQLMNWAEEPLIPIEVQVAAAQGIMPEVLAVPVEAPEVLPEPELMPEPIVESESIPEPEPEVAPESVAEPIASPDPKPVKSTLPKRKPGDISHLPKRVQEQILRSRALTGAVVDQPIGATPAETPTEAIAEEQVEVVTPSVASPPQRVVEEQVEEQVEERVEPVVDSEPVAEPEVTPQPEVEATAEVEAVPEFEAAPEVDTPSEDDELEVELSGFAKFLKSVASEQKQPLSASERNRRQERKILETFIANDPKIKPLKKGDDVSGDAAPLENVSGLVTETLANHYMSQGLYAKAIQAFEILKLKVPQKSAIFAARISEMKQKK